jgi:Ca2+-binding EF-hand superfamily protein
MSLSIQATGGLDLATLYQSLFKKVDSDSDGSITKTEFESAVSSMADSQSLSTDEADALFTKLDTSGDGTVDESEMMAALKTAGEQRRAHMHGHRHQQDGGPDFSQMAQDLIKNIDTSGDGTISKTEFSAAVSALSGNRETSSTSTEALFSKLDTNGDGNVDSSELATALKNMGPPPMPQAGNGPPANQQAGAGANDSEATAEDKLLSGLVASLGSTAGSSSKTDAQSRLLSNLATSLQSSSSTTASSESSLSDLLANLIQSLKSSDQNNQDQMSLMLSNIFSNLQNSSQYGSLGTMSYSASASQSLLSVYG